MAVALSGVGEVAIGRRWERLKRIPVGRRPTAVSITRDGKQIFVADTFSDSVSLLDAVFRIVSSGQFPTPPIRTKIIPEGNERGDLSVECVSVAVPRRASYNQASVT